MNRTQVEAAEAVGEVFDRAGLPWRLEERRRHLLVIVSLPDGRTAPLAISHKPPSGRDTCRLMAVKNARQLLNSLGLKVPRLASRTAR